MRKDSINSNSIFIDKRRGESAGTLTFLENNNILHAADSPVLKGEYMTLEESKRELRPIKEMEKDIRSIEEEIERLMAIATKMTTNYDGVNVQGTPGNKLEEAVVKMESYRSKLSKMLLKH